MKGYVLGSRRDKNNDRQCKLCGDENEGVVCMLWECPVYDSIRSTYFHGRIRKSVVGEECAGGLRSLVHVIILIQQPLFWGVRIGRIGTYIS